MENKVLSLSYLETLSSADLIALADDYGIDLPDNLNRRFIIGELLDVSSEFEQASESEPIFEITSQEEEPEDNGELPESFNETCISVILRNPVWAFVYWDISEAALKKIEESGRFKNLVLRISYFEKEEDLNPIKYYDLQVPLDLRQQYVLLEAGKNFFRVDLVAVFIDNSSDSLTLTPKIHLPKIPAIFSKAIPGSEEKFPKILEISGIKNLLKTHYEKYRQSFEE